MTLSLTPAPGVPANLHHGLKEGRRYTDKVSLASFDFEGHADILVAGAFHSHQSRNAHLCTLRPTRSGWVVESSLDATCTIKRGGQILPVGKPALQVFTGDVLCLDGCSVCAIAVSQVGPPNKLVSQTSSSGARSTHLVDDLGLLAVDDGFGLRETPEQLVGSVVAPAPSQEPYVLFGEYQVVYEITSGGMARAFKVTAPAHNRPLFLKMVHLRSEDEAALLREQAIYSRLEQLASPAVVRIVDWQRDDMHAALVTEWADGGSLARYIKQADGARLQPSEAKTIAIAVLDAVEALHSVGVIHRDIKPDNVVRSGHCWKLADLGIAKNINRIVTGRTFRRYGTLGFAAPEQLQGADAATPADVYSFGKLVVYLLTGQTDPDMVQQPRWRALVRACCAEKPSDRLSVEVVHQRLLDLPA